MVKAQWVEDLWPASDSFIVSKATFFVVNPNLYFRTIALTVR